MPLCWPQSEKEKLSAELLDETADIEAVRLPFTPAMQALLRTQKQKLKADWFNVLANFSETNFETYVYYWLIVNTRSFYFEMPNVEKQPPREDRMVLVEFGPEGYTVTSDRDYDAGEEVYVSYGRHDNDFLLVECQSSYSEAPVQAQDLTLKGADGFILDLNRWDCTSVDHILSKHLANTAAERQLQEAGYFG
ncbi:MAG: hypothetical protein Q9212_003394 [Teloschistes hypoglaucus]